MPIKDVLREDWERFPGNDERRAFAEKVFKVYELLDQGNLAEARAEWVKVTQEAREAIKRLFVRDPDASMPGSLSIDLTKSHMVTIINMLYTSTNNEPLQMEWRSATSSLFNDY